MSDLEWVRRWGESALQRAIEDSAATGASLALYSNGKVVQIHVGFLDHKSRRPVNDKTLYPIACVTKIHTLTLVLQLLSMHALELDTRWIDVVKSPGKLSELYDSVTIGQLLSHTAGVYDMPNTHLSELENSRACSHSLHYVNAVTDPFVCETGKTPSYSSFGYVLLGLTLEEVTNAEWFEVLQVGLLQPLGLQGTMTWSRIPPGSQVALPHSMTPSGEVTQMWGVPPPAFDPSSGLLCTAGDLLSLGRLYLNNPGVEHRIFDHDVLTHLPAWSRLLPSGLDPSHQQTLGWRESSWSGTQVLKHEGHSEGSWSFLAVIPAKDVAVAAFANGAGGDVIADEVIPALLDKLLSISPPKLPSPKSFEVDPADYVGRYRNPPFTYLVTATDTGLSIKAESKPTAPPRILRPVSDSQFVSNYGVSVFGKEFDGIGFATLHTSMRLTVRDD